MKKVYVKPEAETVDFSVEEILMNDIVDPSMGTGYIPDDGWDD